MNLEFYVAEHFVKYFELRKFLIRKQAHYPAANFVNGNPYGEKLCRQVRSEQPQE